jgi:chromosomal replication initiator protein
LLSLDERLKSRLSGGLVVDFLPTNYELRFEILKKKAEVLNINVPTDVLQFIASKIINNIRELEGALNRIWANYELTGKKINIENSKTLLSDLISAREKTISIDSIQKKVSSYYNLSLSDMTSSRRSINIARPRQIAMFLCKGLTSYSYPEIGKAFGGKDHTTVLHAVKKIQSMLESDQKLKTHISDLKEAIFNL